MLGSSSGVAAGQGFPMGVGQPPSKDEVIRNHFQTRKNQLINLKLMEKHLPHELFTQEDLDKQKEKITEEIVSIVAMGGVHLLEETKDK